jgi:hypothetical protein
MITGEWGVGKTYYFKNTLKKLISETPTFVDNKKKYRPLLVSLFGLKSVEEIQTEIFLSLYPILNNKVVKLGGSIGKSLIKGIMHLKNLGEYSEYFTEVEVDKGDLIKFGELVICFDDLERLSENLNLEEFIGYINTLVENENVKILIIANENKIHKSNYFVLKEKVVGNSIEFIPDFSISYDSLIEAKFIGFPAYKKFLIENKGFILEVFTAKSSNLRILAFALSYFQTVYSEISNSLFENDILKEKEGEILLRLLKFSLVVSLEYKQGKISFTKKESLDLGNALDLTISIQNVQFWNEKKETRDEDKSYREKFIEKYYSNDKYNYFQSVFHFLTGGSILKIENLIQELKDLYNIKENKVLPQYEVLKKLGYHTVFLLTESEYNRLTRELLAYTDTGSYNIRDYLTIFYFASRFGNPLKYNLEKLELRIIKGMKRGKLNYAPEHSLDFYFRVDPTSENKDHLIRIREALLNFNSEIEAAVQTKKADQLKELCFTNFEKFSEEVLSKDNAYLYRPIFQHFSPYKFYLVFLKGDNNFRWEIIRFWTNRYSHSFSELKPELLFLEKLHSRIGKKITALPKHGITNFIFREFEKLIKKSIEGLRAAK